MFCVELDSVWLWKYSIQMSLDLQDPVPGKQGFSPTVPRPPCGFKIRMLPA